MTLKESIRFHTEEAEKMKLHKKVNEIILGTEGYERALQEHTQLAEWLKELAERRKLPEIIFCKDCENWDTTWQNDSAPNYHYCPMIDGTYSGDFYCAKAEGRSDDKTNKGSSC